MKLNKFIALLFFANLSFGQYQVTGKLKKVTEHGLHEIILSPEIRSYSKQNLSDVRIFNSKGNEVPYFIHNSNDIALDIFDEYKIISKTAIPKQSTSIVFEVPPTSKNNQLSLFIANSDAVKRFSIFGSDDQKEWFGISESQTLSDLNNATKTNVVKTISYPLNTYRYLKIDFDDKKTLPVNVLKIGNFNSKIQKRDLLPITPEKSSVTEIPSKKETEIHVLFAGPQVINQIAFNISGPTYYNRTAVLYKKTTRQVKRKSQIFNEEIATFELNSKNQNTFTIPEIFEKEFYIKIENQDNLPLSISSVKYNQKPVSLVAELNANETYIIKTGNKTQSEPEYDLYSFRKDIASNLPQTTVYDIRQKTEIKNQIKNQSFWQQSWFMWLCILLGAVTTLFFTASLVKDLKKKELK